MTSLNLSENFAARGFRACALGPERNPFAVIRGDQALPKGITFKWKMGSRHAGDFVWTDGMELLVSSRFLAKVRGFTGFRALPVPLAGPDSESAPLKGYHYIVFEGRCGSFLPKKAVPMPRTRENPFERFRGLCFDDPPAPLDFWVPRAELGFMFVSPRVQDVVASLSSDNVLLTPSEQVEYDADVYLALLEKA